MINLNIDTPFVGIDIDTLRAEIQTLQMSKLVETVLNAVKAEKSITRVRLSERLKSLLFLGVSRYTAIIRQSSYRRAEILTLKAQICVNFQPAL